MYIFIYKSAQGVCHGRTARDANEKKKVFLLFFIGSLKKKHDLKKNTENCFF